MDMFSFWLISSGILLMWFSFVIKQIVCGLSIGIFRRGIGRDLRRLGRNRMRRLGNRNDYLISELPPGKLGEVERYRLHENILA